MNQTKLLTLAPHIISTHFKEGSAFFNTFSGDTFFLPKQFASLVQLLSETPCPEELLFEHFCAQNHESKEQCQLAFQQFITESTNSDMLITV